jgi:hypothetical protein
MSYNMISDHPILRIAVVAIVGIGIGLWTIADSRALRGATRIRKGKIDFEPCKAVEIESFLGVVKSVSLAMSNGTKFRFRPMDQQHALGLHGVTVSSALSLARDPKGGPGALLKTKETEVIGSVWSE